MKLVVYGEEKKEIEEKKVGNVSVWKLQDMQGVLLCQLPMQGVRRKNDEQLFF